MFSEFPDMARSTSRGWFQALIRTASCVNQRLKGTWVGNISDPGTIQVFHNIQYISEIMFPSLQLGMLTFRAASSVLGNQPRNSWSVADCQDARSIAETSFVVSAMSTVLVEYCALNIIANQVFSLWCWEPNTRRVLCLHLRLPSSLRKSATW